MSDSSELPYHHPQPPSPEALQHAEFPPVHVNPMHDPLSIDPTTGGIRTDIIGTDTERFLFGPHDEADRLVLPPPVSNALTVAFEPQPETVTRPLSAENDVRAAQESEPPGDAAAPTSRSGRPEHSPPLQRALRYVYKNGSETGMTAEALKHVSDWRAAVGYREEIELLVSHPTHEQQMQIEAMCEAAFRTGLDLGIDLSERMPTPDDFYFCSPEVVPQLPLGHLDTGVHVHGEIVVEESPEAVDTLEQIGTLLWHRLSHNAVTISVAPLPDGEPEDRQVTIGTPGLEMGLAQASPDAGTNLDRFVLFDQVLARSLHQYTRTAHWPAESGLRDISEPTITEDVYPTALIHGMVGRMSNVTGRPEHMIWQDMWRAKLTGDASRVVRMIETTFGAEGVEILAGYNQDTLEAMLKTAEALGMTVEIDGQQIIPR